MAYDEGGRRYGHMTTNLSEAVNKVLKGARNLPITTLVKCTYARLVDYFVKRGRVANDNTSTEQLFCKKIMEAMQQNQQEACTYHVRRYDMQSTRFQVEEAFNPVTQHGGHKWNAVLNNRNYECGAFQALWYSCSHPIAAYAYVSLDAYQLFDSAYSMKNIVDAYSGQWYPLGNNENIPGRTGPLVVPDDRMIHGKGRPKSTYIRNEIDWIESQQRQKCGYYRGGGQNIQSCPYMLQELGPDDN